MTRQESTSVPLFRDTDPSTSATAATADEATRQARKVQKQAILSLLRERAMTDAGLTEAYLALARSQGWPLTQPDSVRKRRAELMRQGLVVRVGTSRTEARQPRAIWKAA